MPKMFLALCLKGLLVLPLSCFASFSLSEPQTSQKRVGEIVHSNQDNLKASRGGPASIQGPSFYLNDSGRYVVQLPEEGLGTQYVDEDGNVFEHGGEYDDFPGNMRPKQ